MFVIKGISRFFPKSSKHKWQTLKHLMWVKTLQDFYYDVIDDLAIGVVEDTWPMFGSISTPSTPSTSKIITTLASNLDLEVNDTWEVLKI